METQVVVIIGAGGIGIAIARRQGFGKHILLADFNEELLAKAARELEVASYKVSTQKVDVSSRESVRSLVEAASRLGSIVQVVNTAGVSPNMAPPERVLAVDLYGSAVVFEEFRRVIAPGGAGLIISSMAGHMAAPLSKEDDHALAFTPADELLALPVLSGKLFRIPWSRTSSPSRLTMFGCRLKASSGVNAALASTPSAPALLQPLWHSMN